MVIQEDVKNFGYGRRGEQRHEVKGKMSPEHTLIYLFYIRSSWKFKNRHPQWDFKR